MPIYPFERTVFPRRFGSPFIGKGALKGPGGIGDSLVEKTVTDTGDKADVNRKRSRRNAGGENGPSKGLYVGPGAQTGANTPTTQPQSAYPYQYQPQHVAQQVQHHRAAPEDRSIISAAGGMAALGGMGHVEKLPPETGVYHFHLRIGYPYSHPTYSETFRPGSRNERGPLVLGSSRQRRASTHAKI